MIRYLRLYLHFVRFSFSRSMEFRVDFMFRIFMDLVYYAINLSFYRIVFLHTELLGGWTESQMMVFVAGYLFVDALNMTVIGNNMWYLPIYINKGELDYYLTRPVSSLFFLSLRDFAANSFVNLLMTLGILIWSLASYLPEFSPYGFLLYLGLLILGTYLYYLMRILLILPVFWIHSGRGLENIFWGLARFMERPDGIFRGIQRKIFTTIIPFTIIASFPARLLMERFDFRILLHFLLVIAAFSGFVYYFWNRGLKAYSSASS